MLSAAAPEENLMLKAEVKAALVSTMNQKVTIMADSVCASGVYVCVCAV